ncbi:MAG: glycosyltransferase family 2 protein [bacterium]|nr:glycosyltransferase family 2 protein [Planctomycetota bacterium]HIL51529.1 glycosyltransferase family 2 protein [Planctomycetota bacterium]
MSALFGRKGGRLSSKKPVKGASRPPADPLELAVQLGEALVQKELPRCSIIILNLNGRHHLRPCFETLKNLDYPRDRFEVVLVDNGSSDGSVEELKRDHSWVRLLENERNLGFSVGCNQGAEAATDAEVLVFINNDMRVDKGFLRELVSPLVRGECQSTTGKMFSWDGKLINSAGGGMNFYGIGIQRGLDAKPGSDYDWPRKTLFACGGAMAMARDLYLELGGFDSEFFAYYEDVDLGWRSWVQGHEAWYVPAAVCYHHHSSTSRRLPVEMIRLLQVRNPQLACFKNYDDQNLRRILPAMLALALRRTLLQSGLGDDRGFRIEDAEQVAGGPVRRLLEKARGQRGDTIPIKRAAAADLIGINDLLGRFDHWTERRAEVQEKRKREDAEIFRLFLAPKWCIEEEPGYRELQSGLTSLLGLDKLFQDLTEPGSVPPRSR